MQTLAGKQLEDNIQKNSIYHLILLQRHTDLGPPANKIHWF